MNSSEQLLQTPWDHLKDFVFLAQIYGAPGMEYPGRDCQVANQWGIDGKLLRTRHDSLIGLWSGISNWALLQTK